MLIKISVDKTEELYKVEEDIVKVVRHLIERTGGWYGYVTISTAPAGSDWGMLYSWEWKTVYNGKKRGFGAATKAQARKDMISDYIFAWGY